MIVRVGSGYDTHRLDVGGPLILGGIRIEHTHHAVGHSDADVLLHAVTDALLGAAALGDIGDLFPDTEPANRGRDSSEMLVAAHDRVRQAGYQIQNLDCTVFLQRPKLGEHKKEIVARIAQLLQLPSDCVSVKAKTGEHVGPVGRGEAIEAAATVLLGTIEGSP